MTVSCTMRCPGRSDRRRRSHWRSCGRCLAVCRAPLARIVHGWRDGLAGAFRTGVGNGLWCVGCCVPAMLVLVAVGMMSYWWMALAGAFIFVEKRAAFPWAT